jgi:putative transposase
MKYITTNDYARLVGITVQHARRICKGGAVECRMIPGCRCRGGKQYEIPLASLPDHLQAQYLIDNGIMAKPVETTDIEVDSLIAAQSSAYNVEIFNKYKALLEKFAGYTGKELKAAIERHNAENPLLSTSVACINRARRAAKDIGPTGLIGNLGKSTGRSIVPKNLYEHFESLYLKSGETSVESCWKMTAGFALTLNPNLDITTLPSAASFSRRLLKERSREEIDRARMGDSWWNKKFAFYIKRNYNNILPGEIWVSDHAQVDVATSYVDNRGNHKYCFPWVTAWRDFLSGKWLGWSLHTDSPQSDHIFEAFFISGVENGVCKDIIIDNGKDFRCKDFSGGKRVVNVMHDEYKVRCMIGMLNITPHFATPYNGQTKPIERDFLRNKEWLSKHNIGYRGGNVTERPEDLEKRIKNGEIQTFEEFSNIFDSFIKEVVNVSEIKSGHRKGMCPNQIWDQGIQQALDAGKVRRVSADALKLFCMRTSSDYTIGRRGIHDGKIDKDYWGEWMAGQRGRKVFMRRAPKQYQNAWVFDVRTSDYLGKAEMLAECPAIVKTDQDRVELEKALRMKKNLERVTRDAMKVDEVPFEEKIRHMAAATRELNKARGYIPSQKTHEAKVLLATTMDRVLEQERRQSEAGTADLSELASIIPETVHKKVYEFNYTEEDYPEEQIAEDPENDLIAATL